MPRLPYGPSGLRLVLGWLFIGMLLPNGIHAATPPDPFLNQLTPREIRQGWTLLFDGSTTNGWSPRGASDWEVVDGTLTPKAGSGGGFLCTQRDFSDFQLRADFWIDATANSGVFLRCPPIGDITTAAAYEVNIYDAHPKWPTGSINDVGRCRRPTATVGRWNSYDLRAQGTHLVVRLNGRKVLDTHDSRASKGLIGLQTLDGRGVVRFRNLKIRPLPTAAR